MKIQMFVCSPHTERWRGHYFHIRYKIKYTYSDINVLMILDTSDDQYKVNIRKARADRMYKQNEYNYTVGLL